MRLDHGQIEIVDDDVAEVLRQKTPAERIGIGIGLWHSTQKMLTMHLASTHPDWNAQRVEKEVARRLSHGAI